VNSSKRGLASIVILLVLFLAAFSSLSSAQVALSASANGRDEKAVQEALQTWWTTSMKTHDQRIAWWREAQFGCFILGRVYSTFGGEWNGKPFKGYAEHMMRIKKIRGPNMQTRWSRFSIP